MQWAFRALGIKVFLPPYWLSRMSSRTFAGSLTGSGKAQANSSMKSVGIGLGDKLGSLHQVGKELLRTSNENHTALMDGLSAVELAIKNLTPMSALVSVAMPPQPEMAGFPPMPRQPEMSGVAMPRQPDVGGVAAAPMGLLEVPQQPRFDVPAAFHQRKPPGYGSSSGFSRRAYKVVVQGAHGQSRVRAVSPNPIRAEDQPPQGWAQEYGLGNLVIGVYRHRILPDSFIADAEPYPNL